MTVYSLLYFKRKDIFFFNKALLCFNFLVVLFASFLEVVYGDSKNPLLSYFVQLLIITSCSGLIYTVPKEIIPQTLKKFAKPIIKISFYIFMGALAAIVITRVFRLSYIIDDIIMIIMIVVVSLSMLSYIRYSIIRGNKPHNTIEAIVAGLFILSLIITELIPEVLPFDKSSLKYFHILPGFFIVLASHYLFVLKGRFWKDTKKNEVFVKKYKISKREKEVMDLIVSGHSNLDICNNLCVSLSTVKTHVSKIYKKTGTTSRIDLLNLFRE